MESIFTFLRPIVVGFIFASSIMLMNRNNFVDWKSGIIFLVSCLLSYYKKINPIFIIICSEFFHFISCFLLRFFIGDFE